MKLILTSLFLLACNGTNSPETVSVTLSIEGRVVSLDSGTGIPDAKVRLGIGGHFSLPVTVDSATADNSGHFAISRVVQHVKGECGYWVGATAPDYEPSDPAFSVVFLQCKSDLQSVEVGLKPQS